MSKAKKEPSTDHNVWWPEGFTREQWEWVMRRVERILGDDS